MKNKKVLSEKRLKIAHLGQKNCMTTEGGVEVVVAELAKRQAALGHDVTCYNRDGHHVSGKTYDVPKVKNWNGIRMKYVPTIPRKGLAAVSSAFCASVCAAFGNYDVVHIHAEGPAFFSWIPKMTGKKVVTHVHGLDWARSKWKDNFGSKFIYRGEKNLVKYSDEVIVLSKNVQSYFKKTYGRDTVFIPNGVTLPPKRTDEEIKKIFGLEKDSYLLYLSRLVPEKRCDLLIDAYKQILADKKLVIAGAVSDSDEYVNALKIQANKNPDIIFTGFVQGEMLQELYSNAYVYILPSDLEGMPLTLLEAMSYGNCCLTSDIAECTEVIKDKGITFRKGDVDDLKSKLQELCKHAKLVENYKKDAANFVCNEYDWDVAVEQVLKLYRS